MPNYTVYMNATMELAVVRGGLRDRQDRVGRQERCLVKTLADVASLLVTPTADLDY